ncbi:hypothetical protein PDM29_11825 [Stenotrophomonas oahuensis]|uniref:Uncharacterized protein n=1 Tax=Stenotrophomonas oahuensis TaxID=3003271 RepID=A0ABY9YWY0_9GAMM|nr:hypothetical protein [Stenotrophomonas sp. A5586]WNH54689.1 hypothetical protein PDM29_11825 [Stenotrophomonas sp. A5586]
MGPRAPAGAQCGYAGQPGHRVPEPAAGAEERPDRRPAVRSGAGPAARRRCRTGADGPDRTAAHPPGQPVGGPGAG